MSGAAEIPPQRRANEPVDWRRVSARDRRGEWLSGDDAIFAAIC